MIPSITGIILGIYDSANLVHELGQTEKQIRTAFQRCCPYELQVAKEYYERHTDPNGSQKVLSELTTREISAFDNLWNVAQYNGGAEQIGKKIVRSSKISQRLMPGGKLIPKLLSMNKGVYDPLAGASSSFVRSMGFINRLATDSSAEDIMLERALSEFASNLDPESTRTRFMYEVGQYAHEIGNTKPREYGIKESITEFFRIAVTSLDKVRQGSGRFTEEDVTNLVRYKNLEPTILMDIMSMPLKEHDSLESQYDAIADELDKSDIIKNAEELMAEASKSKSKNIT